MRIAVRVVLVVACAAGVVWMLFGRVAGETAIGNAQVLGALGTMAALVVTVVVARPRTARHGVDPVTGEQTRAAVDYLAIETMRHWRLQAHDRRITTPSPASVRWRWAGHDVAVPASELHAERPGVSGPVVLGESAGRVLTAGVVTELRELYQRLPGPHGRIVVLGGPGAGKTAAMLLLLIDILEHRTPGSDEPIPVWLTLGGWNPDTTSLEDWAAAALTRDYPGLTAPAHGGPDTAKNLIRTGRVSLFLDGLDEMAPAIQGQALRAIDRDATGLTVVLTSRTPEYQAAVSDGRLYGAAVIEVLPVGAHDATTFLLADQLPERRRAWKHVTDHLREHPDSPAARALTTPLTLSLARDTYTHDDPTTLLDTRTYPHPDALLHHLLARSLTLAYPNPTERAHATRWLSWIAQHMGTSRDLRWWDIPTWTPPWQRQLTTALAGALAFGLVGGLVSGLVSGLVLGLAGGLAAGIAVLLAPERTVRLEPRILAMRLPTRKELRDLLADKFNFGITGGLGFGISGAISGGFIDGLRLGFVVGFVVGFAVGLALWLVFATVVGLGVGLLELWSTPLPTTHAVDPLEAYRSDRRHNQAIAVVFGLGLGLTAGLLFGLTGSHVSGLMGGLAGVAAGLLFWFTSGIGAGPALQITVAQVTSSLTGQPIKFLALLHTALHRQVLRQAGAVYQFRHAALQDYLTSLTPDRPSVEVDISAATRQEP